MVDTVDRATRSKIMSRVLSKNTGPELTFRKALFARGLRYRLHGTGLPGSPDLVLPGLGAVVFIHGCQWHWHGCRRCRMPKTNVEYWSRKIARNQERDRDQIAALRRLGWRVLIVWECALRPANLDAAADKAARWLRSGRGKMLAIEPVKSGRESSI